ncbi:hypothetical protein [Methylorubrum extorquens]
MSDAPKLSDEAMEVWRQNCVFVNTSYMAIRDFEIDAKYQNFTWLKYFAAKLINLNINTNVEQEIVISALEFIENHSTECDQLDFVEADVVDIVQSLDFSYDDLFNLAFKRCVTDPTLFGTECFDETEWRAALNKHAINLFWAIIEMTFDLGWMDLQNE